MAKAIFIVIGLVMTFVMWCCVKAGADNDN